LRGKRLAVLLSGSGTTLENIFERVDGGELPVEVAVVISSRRDAYGIERAKRRGVPTHIVPRKRHASLEEFTEAVFARVREHGAEIVALAGFMVRIGVPEDFRGRILNVHPALLPSFGGKGYYGHFVHEAVLEHGCKVTGCTVHVVDDEYDHGPIVMQSCVEVREGDTPDSLAERVQAAERELYPAAIRALAEGRLVVEGGRARVLPGG
jgi:formyltetrahydrofolate-dependent phosphoribosylglycinamide formyltransferase